MNEKIIEKIFIIFLLVLGIYYMYLASQTKLLGEDEAFFLDMGKDFSQGNYPAFDNVGRPASNQPLIPLVFAIPFMLFGPSLALAKMIIAIFGILTLLMVYLIGKRINIYYGIVSAFLLLSANLFSHFMMIVYLEIPIAFFSALATYMVLRMNSYREAIATGFILFVSFLAKQSGLFLLAGVLPYEIILYLHKKDKKILKLTFLTIVIATSFSLIFPLRNILLYKYPYILFLNSLFKQPSSAFVWPGISSKIFSTPLFTIQDYTSSMSYLIFIFLIFGVSWFVIDIKDKKPSKELLVSIILSFIFLSLYYIYYFFELGIAEPRNIFIIFPHLALIGGFFVFELQKHNKIFMALTIAIVTLSLYFSLTIATGTSQSQRYPDNYIDALTWLNKNTKKDDIVLTTYAGSVKYFADRDTVWVIKELPDMMSSSNSTYIYNTLKNYNVSYILVWKGVLGEKFIIPESNLLGIFTYNFLNTVISDNQSFNIAYQNQDDIIFKLIK